MIQLCSTRVSDFMVFFMRYSWVFFVSGFCSEDCIDRGVILLLSGFVSVNVLLELTVPKNLWLLQIFFLIYAYTSVCVCVCTFTHFQGCCFFLLSLQSHIHSKPREGERKRKNKQTKKPPKNKTTPPPENMCAWVYIYIYIYIHTHTYTHGCTCVARYKCTHKAQTCIYIT